MVDNAPTNFRARRLNSCDNETSQSHIRTLYLVFLEGFSVTLDLVTLLCRCNDSSKNFLKMDLNYLYDVMLLGKFFILRSCTDFIAN